MVDDVTGDALIQRNDDNAVALSNRLKVYHSQTGPVAEYYKTKGVRRDSSLAATRTDFLRFVDLDWSRRRAGTQDCLDVSAKDLPGSAEGIEMKRIGILSLRLHFIAFTLSFTLASPRFALVRCLFSDAR